MWKPSTDLYNTRDGQVAAIIGGGPLTREELRRVPPDAFLFGVNTNCVGIIEPDLVVALDSNTYPIPHKCKTVGLYDHNDFVIIYGADMLTSTTGFNSAFAATALAVQMGFDAIYLVGIDCYSGARPYANSDKSWAQWEAEGGRPEQHSDNGSRVCAGHWARIFGGYPQVIPMSDILRHQWKLQQTDPR